MRGPDVYNVIRDAGVESLYHANTVVTSCTYLQIGGLASRCHVEDRSLPQTSQYSDEVDKRYGIWEDVFTDGVDIHARASRRNNYGPVLFRLPATILLNLPAGTDVLVTRINPVNWTRGGAEADRYFLNPAELREGYQYGDFGKHVTMRIQGGLLPFPDSSLDIILDDPQLTLPDGVDAYATAVQSLQTASAAGNVAIQIAKRQCNRLCNCVSGLDQSYDKAEIGQLFSGEL